MTGSLPPTSRRAERLLSVALIVFASAVAIRSARPYPSSWSDTSRLATVEALIDHRTLAIDRSVFANTGDKIFVRGHYYSHKPVVPALLIAGVYQPLQWTLGLKAADDPNRFYRLMTIGSSGVAYVIAVWCVFQLGRQLGLRLPPRLLVTASFASATLAVPYARAINDHILLLAVAAVVLLHVSGPASFGKDAAGAWRRPLTLGCLSGLAYAMEAAVGLPLMAGVLALVLYRVPAASSCGLFVVGAAPWVATHHLLNFWIGGTLAPVAMVPEFFQWPGSPQADPTGLTGGWNHPTFIAFLRYAAGLLLGSHGFLVHNLPLWVAAVAVVPLLRRPIPERPEVVSVLSWSACTWVLYAALSTNYSGFAVSIRWFLPLLAGGFFVLAVFLREYPQFSRDVAVLTGLGIIWTFEMWKIGPWTSQPSVDWNFVALAAGGWSLCRLPWGRLLRGAPARAARQPSSQV